MTFFTLFILAVSAFVLGQRHSNFPVKRSEGIVVGAEDGTSYAWESTGTSASCPTLLVPDLQASLVQFDPLFPPQSDSPVLLSVKLRLTRV